MFQVCEDAGMPRIIRSAGVAGLTLAGYKLWQRLPKSQQKLVLAQVKKNGPKVAKMAFKLARARAKR
jgi:hypothetical protein